MIPLQRLCAAETCSHLDTRKESYHANASACTLPPLTTPSQPRLTLHTHARTRTHTHAHARTRKTAHAHARSRTHVLKSSAQTSITTSARLLAKGTGTYRLKKRSAGMALKSTKGYKSCRRPRPEQKNIFTTISRNERLVDLRFTRQAQFLLTCSLMLDQRQREASLSHSVCWG